MFCLKTEDLSPGNCRRSFSYHSGSLFSFSETGSTINGLDRIKYLGLLLFRNVSKALSQGE